MDFAKFHEEDETEKIEDHPDRQQEDDPSKTATPEDQEIDETHESGNELNADHSSESDEPGSLGARRFHRGHRIRAPRKVSNLKRSIDEVFTMSLRFRTMTTTKKMKMRNTRKT